MIGLLQIEITGAARSDKLVAVAVLFLLGGQCQIASNLSIRWQGIYRDVLGRATAIPIIDLGEFDIERFRHCHC